MWPVTLPQKLRLSTYAGSSQDGALRTAMDAGPDFVRPRFTATVDYASGDMVLSDSELSDLMTFYRQTTFMGSQWFSWSHPETGSPAEFRFMGPPQRRALSGDLWQVDLSFEIK